MLREHSKLKMVKQSYSVSIVLWTHRCKCIYCVCTRFWYHRYLKNIICSTSL